MTKRNGLRTAHIALLLLSLFFGLSALAQTLPPKPDRYVTDQAGVLDAGTVEAINTQLEQFEKDTSNQILVAIYSDLPQDADVSQYGTDLAASWGAGQKGKDNGTVLFVFVNAHKMYIAVGRGLEGALPDALCNRILSQEIAPQFKQGNYSAGIQAGVNAMLAASKGEYTGTGSTVQDAKDKTQALYGDIFSAIIILIILFVVFKSGGSGGGGGGPFIFTGGGWGSGGSGGFGGGGGGGGFSGGGGGFAGGGASGSW